MDIFSVHHPGGQTLGWKRSLEERRRIVKLNTGYWGKTTHALRRKPRVKSKHERHMFELLKLKPRDYFKPAVSVLTHELGMPFYHHFRQSSFFLSHLCVFGFWVDHLVLNYKLRDSSLEEVTLICHHLPAVPYIGV